MLVCLDEVTESATFARIGFKSTYAIAARIDFSDSSS